MAAAAEITPATLEQFLETEAAKYNLDPKALYAVALQEGAGGGIGDQGTSFGPFQLHTPGRLPTPEYFGPYSPQTQQWAWSPAGLDYALSGIAGSGAAGLSGVGAIDAIVTNFEQPTNPGAEEAAAIRAYEGNPGNAGASGPVIQDPQAAASAAEAAAGGANTTNPATGAGCDHSGASISGCFCGLTGGTKWYEPWTYFNTPVNFFTAGVPCLASWAYGWLQRLGMLALALPLGLVGLYLIARDAGAAPAPSVVPVPV